jgi:asparagine synthetase B (glutamine-hydrolysing)
MFEQVRRCPGGSVVGIDTRSRRVEIAPITLSTKRPAAGPPAQTPADSLERSLDRCLAAVPPGAELYFSGGVDSSLLATRLRHLGRTDCRLVHFSFGRDDAETVHARRVASALGMPLCEVAASDNDTETVLARIGRDYSYPFADASVLPTNVLAHATIDRRGVAAVIEGTGADGSFAVPCGFGRWRRLYAVPSAARELAGGSYRRLHMWRSDSTMARWCQAARRSAALPLEQAALAQNALEGIAYETPPEVDGLLQSALRRCLDAVLPDAAPDARLGMLDVMFACAGAMAAKTFDPLRARGVQPVYPYLSPDIVYGAALLPPDAKCRGGSKALLKSALARELPAHLVYRAKRGFTPPYRSLFSSPAMVQVLNDTVLSADNPLAGFWRRDIVRSLIEHASRRQLSVSGCDFLWALTFCSVWYRQIREASTAVGRTAPAAREHRAQPLSASYVAGQGDG